MDEKKNLSFFQWLAMELSVGDFWVRTICANGWMDGGMEAAWAGAAAAAGSKSGIGSSAKQKQSSNWQLGFTTSHSWSSS